MSFQSLRRVLRSARKGLCSTCSKARYPQLEAAGAGHVGCLIYTFETLGQLIKDEHEVTAVHVAARKGQIPILIYLIENNLVEGVQRAKNGATPIHDAAGTGHLDCLRYLISHTHLSCNDIDANNSTPLHWASQSGHQKVASWLVLEGKAPIDCVAKNGVTPLHLASSKNHPDLVKWLVRYAYKNLQKPRRLVNAKDKNGATPLYHAAHSGNIEVIQWLAEKAGGDPTIRSNQGLAPLHAATIAGHLEATQYLFQFGSASAPGGLRTSEGACALHFAAAEGFTKLLQWLLDQKECSGNERDYYQSTPMHDAAERGNLKNIQLLCDRGADYTLTDIEGNTPLDLAEKNGQNKCVKYFNNLRKNKGAKQGKGGRQGNLSRSKTTRAEMIDSYRNAPPHQIPVSVFEGEDEDEIDGEPSSGSQWATLRDLIGDEEVGDSPYDGGSTGKLKTFSEAERKRRKLEEDMRREAEDRRRKREELLRKETDIEQEFREKLLSEEGAKGAGPVHVRMSSDPTHLVTADSKQHRMSLPPITSTDAELSQSGLVEKRTKEFEDITPRLRKSKLLSKLRWSKSKGSKGILVTQGSGFTEDPDEGFADEEDLPEPPPVPTIEYLLGKRPVNLRKRASDSLKKEIQQQRAAETSESTADDSDDHSSSHSSSHSSQKHRKKGKKRKRRGSKDNDEESVEWSYNKLSVVPQSSPPRERKMLMERHPIPLPPNKFALGPVTPVRIEFDEVSREFLSVLSDTSEATPSSLSPLSPSPKSPMSPASPTHTPLKSIVPKRAAPKLPPHLQNKQMAANVNNNNNNNNNAEVVKKPSPISKILSSRGRSKVTKPALSDKQANEILEAAKSPTDFMAALTDAINSSPKAPRVTRQMGVASETSSSPPGTHSPTMDEIELQISEMQKTLANSSNVPVAPPKAPPSPEVISDSDSSEFTSSSEENTTSDDSTSSSDEATPPRSGPRRPIMARNIGMSQTGKRGHGVFNRARLLARYPRLLRRNLIKLDPILEVVDEQVLAAATSEARAVIHHRLKVEKRYIKAWRKYLQIMRSAYRKAERIIQRKRRELLARAFYSWIQVRNIGAVEKVDMDRAQFHYQRRLVNRLFRAWHFDCHGAKMPIARSSSMQWLNAEEKYLHWINSQLLPAVGVEIEDIEDSLASGILIIKAIAYASSTNPPKYLPRPKVKIHRQDNWKTAHQFMKEVGINMYGIEPADLANLLPAAIHNMFNVILKWEESR